MKTTSLRARTLACALLAAIATCGLAAAPAAAQTADRLISTPAEKFAIAPGGVDMRSGRYAYSETDLSIGGDSGGLALTRIMSADVPGHAEPFGNFSHNWDVMLSEVQVNDAAAGVHELRIYVHFGGRSQTYRSLFANGGFEQMSDGGYAPLTYSGDKASPSVVYTYTAADGTVAVFRPLGNGDCSAERRCAFVSEIVEADGTRYSFDYVSSGAAAGGTARLGRVTSSRGHALLLEGSGHRVARACVLNLAQSPAPADGLCPAGAAAAGYAYTNSGPTRLASVTRADGEAAGFTYADGANGSTPTTAMGLVKPGQASPWLTNISHRQLDEEWVAHEIVDRQDFADGQSYSYAFSGGPSVNGRPSPLAGGLFTDADGNATEIRYDWPVAPGANHPGSACQQLPCPPPEPIPNDPTFVYQQTPGPVEITDPLGRSTAFDYCDPVPMAQLPPTEHNRCIVVPAVSFTDPEGIKTFLKYDDHRNVIQVKRRPKPGALDPDGTVPADIVTSAEYDRLHPKSSSKPLRITGANGNSTNWTYAPEHGGVLTETGPAPTPGAPAPQTRHDYAQRRAWISNGAGGYVQAATPIWLLDATSLCRTSAATGNPAAPCAAAGDEVRTTYDYGSDSGPNNLLLRGRAVTADGITLRTCYGHDGLGRRISETSPNAGLASCPASAPAAASPYTSATRYDAMGRVTGTIAPDPDGTGPLRHGAVRTTYDPAGRPVRVEQGELAAWQGEAVAPRDWTGFTVLQVVDTVHDALDRKVKASLSGIASTGGAMAIQTVTEHSYDLAGRARCTAVRMNPAEFAWPPRDACLQGTPPATYGPDRITQNDYDAAGQPVQSREGVGTGDVAVEATRDYTASGKLRALIDAKGNRNAMRYDGFDRLQCWILPAASGPFAYDPATPATALASAGSVNGDCAATGDFEYYRYDANGNRTSFRNRAGEMLSYGYDALNRMTLKDRPGAEPDVSYAYDLRGLQVSAAFPSTGEAVTHEYDGFGRKTASVTTMGGISRRLAYEHDAAGNRTRMTWPADTAPAGGQPFFVTYAHDGLDRVTAILEAGSAVIASYAYDPLGRRQTLTRGNGTSSAYEYDGVGRLGKLTLAFPADPARSLEASFTYNPASQMVGRTGSNDAYAFTGHGSGTTASSANGLNQLNQVGGGAVTHDARGNLAAEGVRGFGYSSENLLVALTAGTVAQTMRHDPLMRLWDEVTPGVTSRQYLFDSGSGSGAGGETLVGEYRGTLWFGPYVHGPGEDEPLFLLDNQGRRSWYHADERGSILATSRPDGSGAGLYTYDDYGQRGLSGGRFGYAGKPWHGVAKIYNSRARWYDPKLGRFLQTDPIGYDDQINLYAYVGDDPVNMVDVDGKYRSHWILRFVVPGQVAWDNAVTAFEQRKYVQAAAHFSAMLTEQLITVASAGAASSASRAAGVATRAGGGVESALVGRGFGKLGTVIENQPGVVRGYTRHFAEAAFERGVAPRAIANAIKNPLAVLSQSGGKTLYVSQEAAVVLDSRGIAVTGYGQKDFDAVIRGLIKEAQKYERYR